MIIEKEIKNCYKEFSSILNRHNNPLLKEFLVLINEKTPQEVFLWLDSKYQKKEIPEDIEPLLTDFYGLVH